jgi:hypothetical protein
MRIGYARSSVLEPDAAPQVKALQDAGAEKIYTENVLSNEADRPAFEEAHDSAVA